MMNDERNIQYLSNTVKIYGFPILLCRHQEKDATILSSMKFAWLWTAEELFN